jgi:hypothetical protein
LKRSEYAAEEIKAHIGVTALVLISVKNELVFEDVQYAA